MCRTVYVQHLSDTGHIPPVFCEGSAKVAVMWLQTRGVKIAFLSCASALLFGVGCACARDDGGEFGLSSARPTVGSVDCLRPAGIMSPACPYEIAGLSGPQYLNFREVGTHRVLRLLVSERLHERFSFLKPYDPYRLFSLPAGFTAKMMMGVPGANMQLDLQSFNVDMRLFGGGVAYPFSNDDMYGVMQLSWRW